MYNDWHLEHQHLVMNEADFKLLGKSLRGNTHVRVLALDLSFCPRNNNTHTTTHMETILCDGIASSQVQRIRIAGASRAFHRRLLSNGNSKVKVERLFQTMHSSNTSNDYYDAVDPNDVQELLRDEFVDMCLQLARNDPSVIDLNQWMVEHQELEMDEGDIKLLGKALQGNKYVRLLALDLSSSSSACPTNNTATSSSYSTNPVESILFEGVATSHLQRFRVAGASHALQRRLLSGNAKTLESLDMYYTSVNMNDVVRLLRRQCEPIMTSTSTSTKPMKLTHLSLESCQLGDLEMLSISLGLVGNPILTSLGLGDNRISSVGVMYLCQHWKEDSRLVALDLSGNRIGPNGAHLLVKTIAEQHRNLKILSLFCNETMGCEGLVLVASQFPHLKLSTLELMSCVTRSAVRSTDSVLALARALSDGIRHNTSLNALQIGGNHLGPQGAKMILQAVAAHPSLHSLSFGMDDSIGMAGLKHIGEELRHTKLTFLELDGTFATWPHPQTKLAFEAGRALLDGVKNCPTLTKLSIMKLAPVWSKPIQLYLQLNETCRPLLGNDMIAQAVWPYILAHFDRRDKKRSHMYFCLCEQPWLVVPSTHE